MQKEKKLLSACLCLFLKGDSVLLGMKMKGVGAGFLNSYGGGIEEGENPAYATAREVREETGYRKRHLFWPGHGVTVRERDLARVAVAMMHNRTSAGTPFVCELHVYIARKWEGTFRSTADIRDPQWYGIGRLPEGLMLADRVWMPAVLAANRAGPFQAFRIKASYGPFHLTLESPVEVVPVASF